MGSPDGESAPFSGGSASTRSGSPCPSCGSILREGAILCPHCGTDFRGPAQADPALPTPTAAQPLWGAPPPVTTSDDRRPARLAVIVGAIALLAKIMLPLMARRWPQSYSFLVIWGYGAVLLAVYAILLARQAQRRIENTRDKRGLMMAQFGLILGWATIAYVVVEMVISPILDATSNVEP